jgi:hypothetical protein
MALLDMQGMASEREHRWSGGESELSVLLCNSSASVTLCL